jgi:hypothetical protein
MGIRFTETGVELTRRSPAPHSEDGEGFFPGH